jgi:PKD repeat protein
MVLSNKIYSLRGVRLFAPFLLLLLLPACHLEVLDPIRNGLIAEFDYAFSNQEGDVPIQVNFVNRSTEAVSYRWDFGDGSVLSTEFNPSHEYTKAGDYTVTLTAINEMGEEDFISIPLTLNSRKFVKEWPLGGNSGFVFTGFAPVGDSAYLFSGSGSYYPSGSVLTDLYGDTLVTPLSVGSFGVGELITNVPGYYVGESFANSIRYESNGTVHTSSFSQPDLFLIGQFEDFGYPRHIVFETEGEDGGASSIYFGSEGRPGLRPIRPKIMNFFAGGLISSWPVTLEQFCRLMGIAISPEGGVIGIGFQSSNCEGMLRIEELNSEGTQLKFKNLNIPLGSDSWKIVPGDPGQYIAVGAYPRDNRLLLYLLDNDYNVLSQNFIGTDEEISGLKATKSRDGGSVFIVGKSLSNIKAYKVSNNGSSIWNQSYNFPTAITSVRDIYAASDCGLLIYGSYYEGFNADAPLIIKTDQDGLVE